MKSKKILSTLLAFGLVLPMTLKSVYADETSESTDAEDEQSADVEDDADEEERFIEPRDLGGVTIRYLSVGRGSQLDPDVEDLKPEEKEERLANLEKIEKEWNVKLEFTKAPDVEWGKVPEAIAKAHAAGDDVADIYDLSRVYLPSLARNKAIADLTDVLKDAKIAKRYIDTATIGDHIYGAAPFIAGEGIFYNRKMINDAGMDKTPSEMFDEGKWSYTDFISYMEELASKLPADTKPFLIDPYYWLTFAPGANGSTIVDTTGKLKYTDPAMVETLEVLKTLKDKGLLYDPIKNEEGKDDYWSTPAETFEKGTGVAMTHRASWQAAGLVDKIDFGYVPYPWGSNVTIDESKVGQKGAYKTLSDNYHATAYDAATFVMRAGIEELGNPEDIFYFLLSISDQDYMIKEYLVDNGELEAEEKEYDPRFFSDELDVELYEFNLSRERFEGYPSVAGNFKIASAYYEVMDGEGSVRAALEANIAADQAALDKVYGLAPIEEDEKSDESEETSEAVSEDSETSSEETSEQADNSEEKTEDTTAEESSAE